MAIVTATPALDGLPARLFRFAGEVYGPGVVDEAWAEFLLWDDEAGEFDPDSFHIPVFMPWFFHRWTPDPADTLVAEPASLRSFSISSNAAHISNGILPQPARYQGAAGSARSAAWCCASVRVAREGCACSWR